MKAKPIKNWTLDMVSDRFRIKTLRRVEEAERAIVERKLTPFEGALMIKLYRDFEYIANCFLNEMKDETRRGQ